MKPANLRWYRQEPKAAHVDDVRLHPVTFATKAMAFGLVWGNDRVVFADELEAGDEERRAAARILRDLDKGEK